MVAADGTAEAKEETEAAASTEASGAKTKAAATEVAAAAEGAAEAIEKTEAAATTEVSGANKAEDKDEEILAHTRKDDNQEGRKRTHS